MTTFISQYRKSYTGPQGDPSEFHFVTWHAQGAFTKSRWVVAVFSGTVRRDVAQRRKVAFTFTLASPTHLGPAAARSQFLWAVGGRPTLWSIHSDTVLTAWSVIRSQSPSILSIGSDLK
jgi:hypothetical protein